MKDAYNYIYYYEGNPVGTGLLYMDRDIGFLANGSVLKEYRGKRIQQALVQHRIEKAKSLGGKYVVTTTGMDTTSGRNMERNGFQLAYALCNYVLDFKNS